MAGRFEVRKSKLFDDQWAVYDKVEREEIAFTRGEMRSAVKVHEKHLNSKFQHHDGSVNK